ncbi:phosphatidylserine lipase ABHD16A, partial [Amblyraja radiata]|uniref:phosphatidylserine lipase ABHD16A n=1 Tax=Amblyraja radiata TaxID=386614 RepID=UPI001403BE61
MAGLLHELLRCILGPRLRRVHRRPRHHGDTAAAAATGPGFYYQPRIVEKHSDSILGWAYVLWSVSYYTSPLLLLYFYRKGYIVMSKIIPATPYASAFLLFLTGVACLRGKKCRADCSPLKPLPSAA